MTDGDRLPYLLRSLKAPRILERLHTTAERARAEGWPYEQFLETLCEAEVFAREASGARTRIRAAGFPAPKTLEDFDFAAQPGAERPLIQHLAQLAWIDETANVCFLGPPGTGKTHLATALAIRPASTGTARCSRPRSNGSTASNRRSIATASMTNCVASIATGCSSSTRSATCP
jgi:DNA replication protein DnaC